MKEIENIVDAFLALNEIDDEDVCSMIRKKNRKVNEGKSFSLRTQNDLSAAKEFMHEPEEEVELEVIDADADSIEHLKKKTDYIGDYLLTCNKCGQTRVVSKDKLVPSENDKSIYNLEDECPRCKSLGTGFEIKGLVGKVDNGNEEATLTNDEKVEDEVTFENDQIEEEEPKEETSSEAEEVEPEVDTLDKEEESDGLETDHNEDEDDDLELPTLGDEAEEDFKEDEDMEESYMKDFLNEGNKVNEYAEEAWMMGKVIESMNDEDAYFGSWLYIWPDGETREACEYDFGDREAFEELKEKFLKVYKAYHSEGLYDATPDVLSYAHKTDGILGLRPIKNLKPRVHEDLIEDTEDEENVEIHLTDVLDSFVDPENIESINVSKNGESLYEGTLEDLPEELHNEKFKSFNVGESILTCNINNQPDEEDVYTLKEFLEFFDDEETDKISVIDSASSEELMSGTKEEVINQYGDSQFIFAECPERLNIELAADEVEETEDDMSDVSDIDEEMIDEKGLFENICKANGLATYRKNNPSSQEYWINESIKEKEDLDLIYERYVKNTEFKNLIEQFKSVTGYKDELDIMCEKYGVSLNKPVEVNETAPKPNGDKVKSFNRALKIAKETGEDIVYGYDTLKNPDKFYEIDPVAYDHNDNAFRRKYGANTIYVAYPDKSFRKEEALNEKVDINKLDDEKPLIEVEEDLNFNNKLAKELANAIVHAGTADPQDATFDNAVDALNSNVDLNSLTDEEYYDLLEDEDKLYSQLAKCDTQTLDNLKQDLIKLYVIEEDLTEAKKSKYGKETFPAGNPAANAAAFNHAMGSDVGSGSEGGECCGESLEEDIQIELPEEEAEKVVNEPVEELPVSDLEQRVRDVMASYQTANKWLDTVKEAIYTKMNCPFFSSFIHELAHSMPGRFDKFGDILHTINMEIPYPETNELSNPPQNLEEAFNVTFNVLNDIKAALNEFIKFTDDSYHGMSCAAEALLNDIEGEYPMLYRLQAKAKECGDDTVSFDKFVGQYVEHKDELLESLNEKLTEDDLDEVVTIDELENNGIEEDKEIVDYMKEIGAKVLVRRNARYFYFKSMDALHNYLENGGTLPISDNGKLLESLTEAKKDDEIDKVTDSMEKIETVIDLVQDEVDAVDGYTDAIETLDDSKIPNKEEIVSKLHHIKGEELNHLDELKDVEALMPTVGELADEPEIKEEPLDEEPVEEEPIEEVDEYEDVVESYTNRRELGEAIEECKNNNTPFNVRRSTKEGFRYDLVKSCPKCTSSGPDSYPEEPTVEEEVKEQLNESEVEFPFNPDDLNNDARDALSDTWEEEQDLLDEVNFDTDKFDEEVNRYFDENYSEAVHYLTTQGEVTDKGVVILEGVLSNETNETIVKFTLTPEVALNESLINENAEEVLKDLKYKVENDLSDEVLTFKFTNDTSNEIIFNFFNQTYDEVIKDFEKENKIPYTSDMIDVLTSWEYNRNKDYYMKQGFDESNIKAALLSSDGSLPKIKVENDKK